GSQFQRLGQGAGRQHRVEVRRVVRIHSEDEQAERALVLDEGAVQAAAKVGVALRSSRADERTGARERIVADAEVREVADGPEARLRDDFDRYAARAVEFGRELIP